MPIEERFITFNLDEIYKSVSIRCVQENRDTLPNGKLIAIKVKEPSEEGDGDICLHVKTKDNEVKLHYERDFFALALVFYCQGCGIPLPKRGKKILKITSDCIIMKIDL